MKKDFEQPVLEVVAIGDGDVIVTSSVVDKDGNINTDLDTDLFGINW